jgi:hypothetical protein
MPLLSCNQEHQTPLLHQPTKYGVLLQSLPRQSDFGPSHPQLSSSPSLWLPVTHQHPPCPLGHLEVPQPDLQCSQPDPLPPWWLFPLNMLGAYHV